MSRNGFWDRYWGRAGQKSAIGQFFSLSQVTVPKVIVKVNLAQFTSHL